MDRAAAVLQSGAVDEQSLGVSIIRSAAWNVVGTVVKQGITIGATVIVARLLSPGDYAIGGLAISVMGLFAALTGQGFAQALVQRKDLSDITCHSVFWPMAISGIALTGLAVTLAPWLARFYDQPALIPVIWALSVGLAFGMVGAVPNALLQRAMRFREINVIGIAGGLVSAGLGIGAAALGFGYWALIAPVIGSMVAVAIGAFGLSGYRPRLVFSWVEFKTVVAFGLSLLGSNLLLYVDDYSDRLILGRFWTAEAFGYYYFALERSRQPFSLIMGQLSAVIFPAFSAIQDDYVRLRRAVIFGTHRFCLIVFPLYVLLVVLADPALPWLFGQQWRPAIPIFQIFAAFSFARGFAALVPGTYLAIGRPQAHLIFNIFRVGLILPTLIYLGFRGTNALITSITLCVIWLVQLPFFVGYLFQQIRVELRDVWWVFKWLLLATAIMYVVALSSRAVLNTLGWSSLAVISVSSIVSLSVFAVLMRGDLLNMVHQIRGAVQGANRKAAI